MMITNLDCSSVGWKWSTIIYIRYGCSTKSCIQSR